MVGANMKFISDMYCSINFNEKIDQKEKNDIKKDNNKEDQQQ